MTQVEEMTPAERKLMAVGMLINNLKSAGFAVRRKSNLDITVYLTSRSVTIVEVEEALLGVGYESGQFELERDDGRVIVKVITEVAR